MPDQAETLRQLVRESNAQTVKPTKPTIEQIEKYIQAADAELGPWCTDEWVEWCRQALMDKFFEGMKSWDENKEIST